LNPKLLWSLCAYGQYSSEGIKISSSTFSGLMLMFTKLLRFLTMLSAIVTGGAFMFKSDLLREKMGAGCAD